MGMEQLNLPFCVLYETQQRLLEESIRLARSVHAKCTLLGYSKDWRSFLLWCAANNQEPLPAAESTLKLYVTDMLCRGHRIGTVRHHCYGIVHYHRMANHASPYTRETLAILRGAQRLRGEQPRQKTPINLENLRQMLRNLVLPDPWKTRDRALLLLGFSTALRRSNIVGLDLADIEFTQGGLLVHVRREKQDQTGIGRTIGVPPGQAAETCPLHAIKDWLQIRGHRPGPLLLAISAGRNPLWRRLNPNTVGEVVKRAAESIGLDPGCYAGHSLRAGFVTEALPVIGEILTARHTGHRSLQTLKRYMREENPFEANACAALGL